MIGYYKIGSVFLILGLLLSILAPAAYADLNTPDTVEIEEVRCWKHMLEPDDVLIVARYNVHYGNLTAQPYQSIDQTFRFAYGNSTGTELGNSTAYPGLSSTSAMSRGWQLSTGRPMMRISQYGGISATLLSPAPLYSIRRPPIR